MPISPITYPCADWLDGVERGRFGESKGWAPGIRAVATEEYRPPRAGERFLSGASPVAYKAFADMNVAYRIARLVRVKTETVTITTIVGDRDE